MLCSCGLLSRPSPAPPPPTSIASEARARLLEDARTLLARGECREAARQLTRMMRISADPITLSEAHWLLARCHEQTGELQRALQEYDLAAQAVNTPYAGDAARRVVELRTQLRDSPTVRRGVNAVLLTADALPTGRELEFRMAGLATAGITVLLIQVTSVKGVYFPTSLAPVVSDALTEWIAVGHRHGMLVYGALSLDVMDWVKPGLGWHDVRYDPRLGREEASAHLDLFHPAFQEYLSALTRDLVRSGVDGILFRAAPPRLEDGFSPFAREAFQRQFQILLDPSTLLMPLETSGHDPGAGVAAIPRNGSDQRHGNDSRDAKVTPSDAAREPSAAFWHWAGWKARSRAKLLQGLIHTSQRINQQLRIAIEFHLESVTEPVRALAQYGEDLLALKRLPVDFYFSLDPASVRTRPVDLATSFLPRAEDLLGGLDRLWLARASLSREKPESGAVPPGTDRRGVPPEVGLVYDNMLPRAAPIP